MQLKHYQRESLERLEAYLDAALLYGSEAAWRKVQTARMGGSHFPPFQALSGLEAVPYVCLRLPTGGGKTLLCAHSIQLAAKTYLQRDFPLVLWLVPTTTIKTQTLETLKTPAHANYRALSAAFNDRFRVFDIADFVQLRPQDLQGNTCIVVATFAALRVESTEGRRVYDHHEELEAHFAGISPNLPNLERNPPERGGGIKYSFVNLLHTQRPLVLVDEAHNAKSDLSIEVLRRVNPAAVIEYTATPAKNSNVIQSVSAAQLKAEHMIKLPIVFASHLDWQAAVTHSVQTRARLEQVAQHDADYIRPIALFQAENKGGDTTVEVLRDFLLQQENIPVEHIAIATGDQRELDGLNLFDPNCPIRYVITVQALKEGWDCSFAYVLCSVANTRSPVAVEQLLGRVLRMPYAKQRNQAELNQAYAHVSAQSWPHAVSQLTDRLVSMGFEKQEVETCVYTQPSFPGLDDTPEAAPLQLLLSQPPELSVLDLAQQAQVTVQKTDVGYWLQVSGTVDAALLEKLSQVIVHPKDKREWQLQTRARQRPISPAEQGVPFTVPQLCLDLNGELVVLEKEDCLVDEINPLDSYTPLTAAEFALDETAKTMQADIEGERIKIAFVETAQQLPLDGIPTQMDATGLVATLAFNLYQEMTQAGIRDEHLQAYVQKTVSDLLARGDMNLPKLIRGRFVLEKIIRERLKRAQQQTYKTALQQVLLDDTRVRTDLATHGFRFPPDYPAHPLYDGILKFKHHYYPTIAQMNGEEADCARVLDTHPKIKYWIRNLERQLQHAFSLPTSSDWFYPDFVAQLDDGRILVVEYKGEHLKGSEDTQEKDGISRLWAKLSGNLFLMAYKHDAHGHDVAAQVRLLLD